MTLSGPVTTCRSCGAPVRWAVTEAGKRSIVDAHPVEGGNLVATSPGSVRAASKEERERCQRVGLRECRTPLYVSHVATCPHSKGWRR